MNWFTNLFSTHREFTGDFVETGEVLLDLVASNQVVMAEFEQFKSRVKGVIDQNVIEKEAAKSATALSGYGIAVKPKAFIEAVDLEK